MLMNSFMCSWPFLFLLWRNVYVLSLFLNQVDFFIVELQGFFIYSRCKSLFRYMIWTYLSYSFFGLSLARVGFELRASGLQSRCYTTCHTCSPLSYSCFFFQRRESWLWCPSWPWTPGLEQSSLSLLSNWDYSVPSHYFTFSPILCAAFSLSLWHLLKHKRF
jgi:hypothetical protein